MLFKGAKLQKVEEVTGAQVYFKCHFVKVLWQILMAF